MTQPRAHNGGIQVDTYGTQAFCMCGWYGPMRSYGRDVQREERLALSDQRQHMVEVGAWKADATG